MRARRFERIPAAVEIDGIHAVRYRWTQRAAQRIVRLAGSIYQPKKDEWWADLIFFQQKEYEAGLRLATSCLVSSPGLAWPHVSLQLTAWLLTAFVDVSSRLLHFGFAIVVRCVVWSPQALGIATCSLVGYWLPIPGISHPEIASLVILAPAGIYIGTTFPRAFLSVLGAAGGAAMSFRAGGVVGGDMSLPLFAVAGILIGEGFGIWWADTVAALGATSVRAMPVRFPLKYTDRRPERVGAAWAAGGRILAKMQIFLKGEAGTLWERVAVKGVAGWALITQPIRRPANVRRGLSSERAQAPQLNRQTTLLPLQVLLPDVASAMEHANLGEAPTLPRKPRSPRRTSRSDGAQPRRMRRPGKVSAAPRQRPDRSIRRHRPELRNL